MAKFKFGTPPKTFKRNIKFKTLEGVDEDFDVTFRYRTRKEFSDFFDELRGDAKARSAKLKEKDGSDDEMTMAEIMDATVGDNGKYLLKALDGWELDSQLNETNANRLSNEFPAAATAIMNAYRDACLDGRLGN